MRRSPEQRRQNMGIIDLSNLFAEVNVRVFGSILREVLDHYLRYLLSKVLLYKNVRVQEPNDSL